MNDTVVLNRVRGFSARCLDMDSDRAMVLHQVDYQLQVDGAWVDKTTRVMALDPVDAIKYVKGGWYD